MQSGTEKTLIPESVLKQYIFPDGRIVFVALGYRKEKAKQGISVVSRREFCFYSFTSDHHIANSWRIKDGLQTYSRLGSAFAHPYHVLGFFFQQTSNSESSLMEKRATSAAGCALKAPERKMVMQDG
ncbi:neuroligin 4 [Plakobranchus ocellatus]|uniref:Neuroligin 4 n=1 Tax=Plakobranchus ocellatus TaxID=259542 RepID=A0AAV3XUS7_9GAST|nr:neuroligin 4 [Plakobranchus ocellatus]